MQQNLIDNGIPCALSLSAGTYLCNQVFYTMRHEIATNNLPIRAGFIHLPALPLQAAAMDGRVSSMSLQTALEALHLLIRVLTQTKTIKQTRG
jgi:pyroglutamyl-peptidase